jgi:hypothetical protein
VEDEYLQLEAPQELPVGKTKYRLQSVEFPRGRRVTSADLANLEGIAGLKTLGCYGTELTDEIGPQLARLSTIEQLSLGNTDITNDILKHIAKLPKLTALALGETNISDAAIEHLATIKTLRSLDLRQTTITDAGEQKLHAALPDCEEIRR